jgi:hypothetical protein
MNVEVHSLKHQAHDAAGEIYAVGARFTRRDLFYVVLMAVVVVAVGWPLLQGKLTAGHDAGEYSVRLAEFERALRDGIMLPRWAPDVDFGYGSPIFVFLPPLIYYLASVPGLLGADLISALNLAGLLIIAASGLGMYLLARELYGSEGGLLSAIAYLLAPAYLVTLYVRHAFTDFSALAVLPFCFWAMLRLAVRPSRSAFFASTVSVALLSFASYSVSLIALPILCLRPLYALTSRRAPYCGVLGLAAIAGGGMLSAFAWLPTLLERSFVHAERLLQGELYAYANHFVYPIQLLSSPWGYGVSQPGPRDGFSFELGPVHLALTLLGLLWVVRAWTNARPVRAFVLWMAAALGYACLMSVDAARPIWDNLPALQFLQFPWRFLVLAAFALSALAGLAAANLPPRRRLPVVIAAVGVALLMLEGLPHAHPQELYTIAADEFTPQSIARRSLRATDADEYQPVQVTKAPEGESPQSIEVLSGTLTIRGEQKLSHQITWSVDAGTISRVRIATFFYPGWRAYADATPLALSIESETGLMLADIPAGTHELVLRFEDSPERITAKWVSVLGLVFLGIAGWRLPWQA